MEEKRWYRLKGGGIFYVLGKSPFDEHYRVLFYENINSDGATIKVHPDNDRYELIDEQTTKEDIYDYFELKKLLETKKQRLEKLLSQNPYLL